jgi:hypothetical protein
MNSLIDALLNNFATRFIFGSLILYGLYKAVIFFDIKITDYIKIDFLSFLAKLI